MMDLLQTTFFHGSERNDLKELNHDRSEPSNPFGQAIYLSAMESTARCYARSQGTIYHVRLNGNAELRIDLDASFHQQTMPARKVIREIAIQVDPNYSPLTSNLPIQTLIGGKYPHDRPLMTERLLDAGIWLIYGTLGTDQNSGPRDDGVQYAVLHPDHLKVAGTKPLRDEIATRHMG